MKLENKYLARTSKQSDGTKCLASSTSFRVFWRCNYIIKFLQPGLEHVPMNTTIPSVN